MVIASICPSVCPLCYLLIKSWTIFNQTRCASYSHEWGVQQPKKIAPSPGALGRGQKVKYHLILIAKSISKIFLPKLCIAISRQLPNLLSPRFFKKAKGISISPPSVCLLCYLLLNHWTKFNQVCSVSY